MPALLEKRKAQRNLGTGKSSSESALAGRGLIHTEREDKPSGRLSTFTITDRHRRSGPCPVLPDQAMTSL